MARSCFHYQSVSPTLCAKFPYSLVVLTLQPRDLPLHTVMIHLVVQAYHMTRKTFAVFISKEIDGGSDFCFLPHVDIPKDVFSLLVWIVGYGTILRFRKPHLNPLVISPIPPRSTINSYLGWQNTIRMQRHLEVHPVAWHRRCRITSPLRISTFSTVRMEVHSSCNMPVSRTWDRNLANFVVEINLAMESGTWGTTDEHYHQRFTFWDGYSG